MPRDNGDDKRSRVCPEVTGMPRGNVDDMS